MPLYEYKCHRCNKTFEIRQKFADEPLTVHEECGGDVERLISAPALQFKGTGWYVTDYGKGGSVRPGNGSGKSESGSDSKSDSKSDSGSSGSKSSDSAKSESKPKAESKPAPSTT